MCGYQFPGRNSKKVVHVAVAQLQGRQEAREAFRVFSGGTWNPAGLFSKNSNQCFVVFFVVCIFLKSFWTNIQYNVFYVVCFGSNYQNFSCAICLSTQTNQYIDWFDLNAPNPHCILKQFSSQR